MNRLGFLFVISLAVSSGSGVYDINTGFSDPADGYTADQDTIKERQALYNGIIWTNRYHRIEGDQFLFSGLFIPATISLNGRTFKNVKIKYDIYSDEIITPVNSEDILALNKEMVDSFLISIGDKEYRFTNIRNDTLKDFRGYLNLLYHGSADFYVKHKKTISPHSASASDGTFIQSYKMYLVKGAQIHPINGLNDLVWALNADKQQIRNFIKKNKLRISRKNPASYVPIIRYYDSISQ